MFACDIHSDVMNIFDQAEISLVFLYASKHNWKSKLPYSRKFLKGLIFENFESSQAFLKIIF